MRAVVQRVLKASVEVNGKKTAEIGKGLVVFAAIGEGDADADLNYIADKVANLRVFEGEAGKMSLSPIDARTEILVISNFTLYGDVRRGRRPDFASAAKADVAMPLFDKFVDMLKSYALPVRSGEFQAMMNVVVENDGPVTILLDSRKTF